MSAAAGFPREEGVRRRLLAVPAIEVPLGWLALGLAVVVCASLARIGADAFWLAALGRTIVESGAIPDGVPFASAPSTGWENVPALGEVAFHGLVSGLGDRGLVLAQVAAVALALAILAFDMRAARASEAGRALVLLVLVLACLHPFAVARAQLFSLALFPLLLALLRAEARDPSRRIWLLVPLVALWSNLHGAVLVGVAVAGAYLLVHRLPRQPFVALAVLASSLLALCATPSLERTPDYYLGVLENEASRRGLGLWAPLSLDSVLDVLFVASALFLIAAALRYRPRAWELVALAGLCAMTVDAARSGVWLALLAATPAACGLGGSRAFRPRLAGMPALAAVLAAVFVLGAVLVREPASSGPGEALRRQALELARGTPVLADGIAAERLALDGATVWMSNPLDAFAARDQSLYLDWLEGLPSGDAAADRARAILVQAGSPPDLRLARRSRFHEVARDAEAVLYERGAR